MIKIYLITAAFLALLLSGTEVVSADCAALPTIEQAFNESEIVFMGKTISITKTDDGMSYITIFKLENVWKREYVYDAPANMQQVKIIAPDPDRTSVGVRFEQGKQYIIYL